MFSLKSCMGMFILLFFLEPLRFGEEEPLDEEGDEHFLVG
jgi:hypothetical protein